MDARPTVITPQLVYRAFPLIQTSQSALAFIGYDAVAHMTEEMPRPSRDAPQAMIAAVLVGGAT
jgi:amino acid transporter